MLIEGVVAVIALGTVMISGAILGDPTNTYAVGFGRFSELIGIDPKIGKSLGLLALNSFLLTSLDTATRLTRYQIQELTGVIGLRPTRSHCPRGVVLTRTTTPTVAKPASAGAGSTSAGAEPTSARAGNSLRRRG